MVSLFLSIYLSFVIVAVVNTRAMTWVFPNVIHWITASIGKHHAGVFSNTVEARMVQFSLKSLR